MKTASVTEAKNQLSRLLELVKQGQSVTITDRRIPVARLEPISRQIDTNTEAHLTRLERQGLIKRGDPTGLKHFLGTCEPVIPTGQVDVVRVLLEQRSDR